MAEGARLESVFTRKGNVGSNPTLSAILLKINELIEITNPLSGSPFLSGTSAMRFRNAQVRSVKPKTDWLGIILTGEERRLDSGQRVGKLRIEC